MNSNFFSKCIVATAFVLTAGAAPAAELTVSAASSLTNAFKEIAVAYERQYPGSKVALNFGASGALLQQLAKGAPVDVFASADQETMDMAQQQGLVKAADRRDFVRNTLVLIVPSYSTPPIRSLEDLTHASVKRVAIGIPASVPVGRYSKHALDAKGLWGKVAAKAINTQNVRQSLDYVARGEVDAGFVYVTDAAIMKDKVKVVATIPTETPIRYPIAAITGNPNPDAAHGFIDFVVSPAAQSVLTRHGFLRP